MYHVVLDRDVTKDLSDIPKRMSQNILRKIENLANNPRPHQSQKLSATENAYRLRVGDYRVIYTIDDSMKVVTVYHIRHRKDVYRFL
ncbi:MAG: type II toxin-antitoxin system RelE/ParE family toxin [Deltaproteobacteria bacterium]|nr:type II toxin-antitoxin system RelE/ParE family toxin [Deltaproteobacteria bacterium]